MGHETSEAKKAHHNNKQSLAVALKEKDVCEFLLLLFVLVFPLRLLARRETQRRHRLDVAFHRASSSRGSGIGCHNSAYPVFGRR
ncbi:hypothetical protein GCM10027396_36740 [Insolitispirillum peregrinum]